MGGLAAQIPIKNEPPAVFEQMCTGDYNEFPTLPA